MNRYRESVPSSRWLILLALLAAAGALIGAGAALRGDDGGRVVTAVVLVVLALVLGGVAVFFARLRVELDERLLRFHFGPFGRTLDAAEIRSVEPAPYPALPFGGWGIRFGRMGGHSARAYSVPFLRSGVAVEMNNGKRYYVSSRQPEALARAVGQLTRTVEGQE